MSHGLKLTFFFAVSVVLHGAGLWAAAGRIEPRSAEPAAEVAIIDRDLFFRHAARSETQTSQPVSASDRLAPVSGDAVRPSQAEASVMPAPAAAARESEPERRSPQAQASAVARLDPSTLASTAPPRREPVGLEAGGDAERSEPLRVSGVAAAPARAALRPRIRHSTDAAQAARARASDTVILTRPDSVADLVIAPSLQPAADATQATRARAVAPASAPHRHRAHRPVGTATQLHASAAESLPRTAADAAVRGTVDVVATRQADSLPMRDPSPAIAIPAPMPDHAHELERGESEPARRMAAAESARLEQSATRAPAGEAAPEAIAPSRSARPLSPASDVAPAQVPPGRPALRGTLPPPLLTPRAPQGAEPVGAPLLAPAPGDGLRLRATLPGETPLERASVAAVPAEAAPPAERIAARSPQPAPPSAPQSAPQSAPSAPPPAAVLEAAPRELAVLAPAAPVWRGDASGRADSGRGDPADRFTRTYQGGECFFPVRGASQDGGAIRGYGLQAESVETFRQAFVQALGSDPQVEWKPLTDAQCGGISFTRVVLGGAAPSVHIGLARKELEIGEELAGRVTGSRFDFVTLLVVDDGGLVHNVLEYLRSDTADRAFSVPVHPVDDGKDRVQLIMAVGASKPLAVLKRTTAMHSDDFFPELLRQAEAAEATLELGLEDFVILESGS
jgi:hypothetical protein